jgi:nitrite reductase/ring-hydroxylating ferredoxin subunit
MPWVFAASYSEFAEGGVIGVTCGGERLALYKLPDGYFATSDTCPHQGGSLSEGCVVENCIECPLHFALFDIRTGAATAELRRPRSGPSTPVSMAGNCSSRWMGEPSKRRQIQMCGVPAPLTSADLGSSGPKLRALDARS